MSDLEHDREDVSDEDDGVEELAERVHETAEDAMRSAVEYLERDNEDDE